MSKWYIEKGEQGDVVMSTRVRLARNLAEYPFPGRLDTEGKKKVNELVKNALLTDEHETALHYINMTDKSREHPKTLAEPQQKSPD